MLQAYDSVVSPRIPCLVLAIIGFVSFGCGQSPPAALAPAVHLPERAPGLYSERMASGGLNRSYELHVPRAYDATKPLALVILLHGLAGSAAAIEASTGMPGLAEREGFVLVTPEGTGDQPLHGWNADFFNMTGADTNDVGFIDSLIDKVEGEVGIDPDRVFVAGHSNGAFLAHLLGARLSKKIAAIAAVAGTIGIPQRDGGMKQIPRPGEPVSVLIVHGKVDPMVQYDSHARALLHDIGALDSGRFWARCDGCTMTPVETASPNHNVITDTFSGGKNRTEVTVVSIVNGVHDWPGGMGRHGVETSTGVNATDLIWQFFKTHPKQH